MSELVLDPDVPQPAAPPAQENQPAAPPPQAVAPPPDDDDPTAGLDDAEAKLQALHGALTAARGQLRELKPLAQKASQLERESAENRGIVEFLKANPHIMQPPAPPPQRVPDPQADPELSDIAKDLDLYTPDGKPDVARAARIREREVRTAQQIAQHVIAPVQETTFEQRAAQNIQEILTTSKVDRQHLVQAVKTITSQVPKGEAMRILADPTVASVIELTALGLQAKARANAPPPVKPPDAPPLHVETGGGGEQMELSDSSKRLAKAAGIKESDFLGRMKKYQPGRPNVLE